MTTWKHPYYRISCVLLAAVAMSCTVVVDRESHEIRGQVVSSSGQPVEFGDPLAVLARPVSVTLPPRSTAAVVRPIDAELSPPFLVLAVGQNVQFVNDDEIFHSFFSSSKHNAFDLGLLDPGKSKEFRFLEPGPVHVYCSLHTGEETTILVADTPHFAIVGPTGEFVIRNLQPGVYILETWSESFPPQRKEVNVSSGGGDPVELPVDELDLQGSG